MGFGYDTEEPCKRCHKLTSQRWYCGYKYGQVCWSCKTDIEAWYKDTSTVEVRDQPRKKWYGPSNESYRPNGYYFTSGVASYGPYSIDYDAQQAYLDFLNNPDNFK